MNILQNTVNWESQNRKLSWTPKDSQLFALHPCAKDWKDKPLQYKLTSVGNGYWLAELGDEELYSTILFDVISFCDRHADKTVRQELVAHYSKETK